MVTNAERGLGMSWVDKALKQQRAHRIVKAAMQDPRYIREQKQARDEEIRRALDMFLVVSVAYLCDRLGFGREQIVNFIEYADEQMKYLDELPDYFTSMNDAIREETGVDVMRLEVDDR